MEKIERTLIIMKPDCLQRNLVGEVVGRFERKRVEDYRYENDPIDRCIAGGSLFAPQRQAVFSRILKNL